MATISVFFAALGEKSGSASTRDVQRRLMILWIGVGVAIFYTCLMC